LMKGPAYKVDKNIAEKYGKTNWLKNSQKSVKLKLR